MSPAPKSDRQIIGIFADPELLRGVDHLGHAGLRRGAHRHQVARLLDAPAHRLRPRITPVEIDEAFVAKPGALPDAERRIDNDRSRREAVLERGRVDDRLECRAGLTERLGRAVVARADDVEAALHRQHSAGVHLFGDKAAADLGDRAEDVSAWALLLDDDDHAGREVIEGGAADSALGHQRRGTREGRGRTVAEADPRFPAALGQDNGLAPIGKAGADRSAVQQALPVSRDVDALFEVDPAASGAVEAREAFAERFGRGVLHLRVHRGPDPQPSGIDAVRALLGGLAELVHQGRGARPP